MHRYFVGCDLGGTNVRAALVDTVTGEISNQTMIPTMAREGHEAVMKRIADLVRQVIQKSGMAFDQIGGVSIGMPGTVDMDNGVVLFLPNLPGQWREVPLCSVVAGYLGLPVFLMNDVRAITFGEWKFGAGKGVATMVCFAIGTGIGGGLVINHKLHLGIGGTAGELGHQTIDMNGPHCGCGNNGCVEAYASGPAIAAAGIKAVVQGATSIIGEMVGYDLNKINAGTVAQAALDGDQVARKIFDDAGTALGVAISNLIVSVSPDRVVVGGGVIRAGDLLLDPIRRTVRQRVHVVPIEKVEIVPALLCDTAGIIGNAMWAKEKVLEGIQ